MGGFNLADTSVTTSLKYGLNASAKRKPAKAPRALAAFADADDDDDGPSDAAGARSRERGGGRQQAAARDDARARALHAAALQQDASVFEYDAHHDAHRDVRREARREADAERVDRESKYVETLMRRRDERGGRMRFCGAAARARARARGPFVRRQGAFRHERATEQAQGGRGVAGGGHEARREDALAFSSAARRGDFQSSFYGGLASDPLTHDANTSTSTKPKTNETNTHAALGAALRDEETHDAVTGKTGKTAATRNRGDERSRDGHVNGHERVTSKNSMPLKRTTMEKRSISETGTAKPTHLRSPRSLRSPSPRTGPSPRRRSPRARGSWSGNGARNRVYGLRKKSFCCDPFLQPR